MHHETSRIFYPFLPWKEVQCRCRHLISVLSGLQECNYVTLQYKQVMMHAQPPLDLVAYDSPVFNPFFIYSRTTSKICL